LVLYLLSGTLQCSYISVREGGTPLWQLRLLSLRVLSPPFSNETPRHAAGYPNGAEGDCEEGWNVARARIDLEAVWRPDAFWSAFIGLSYGRPSSFLIGLERPDFEETRLMSIRRHF